MREYSELRLLRSGGRIGGLSCDGCAQLIRSLSPRAEEPSRELDLRLLDAATGQGDPLALLALRCRVSHSLEAWLLSTHGRYRTTYGLELAAMASYALDDTGSLSIRTAPGREAPFTHATITSMPRGLISPFTAEVIRTHDPHRCGLPHWARLKLQCHNELKAHLREHGLLLISDWALLADSSARRVADSWRIFGEGALTVAAAVALHAAYRPLYRDAMQIHRQAVGRASGWQPDAGFLRALSADQPEAITVERLVAIAAAIRRLESGRWQQGSGLDHEQADQLPAPASDPEPEMEAPGLRSLIDQSLERAMASHLPAVLASEDRQRDLLRCLWSGWAEGLSNRPLAERCGTSCGTVSKKLRPTEHATTIATAAAADLQRHPSFARCGQSVEAAERLVAALRNHLLEPEQEGEVAPLRRWIQQHLSQP